MTDEAQSAYTIRPAVQDDLDRLAGLVLSLQDHLEAANPELWRMTDQARSNLKGQMAGRLLSTSGRALVAEHETDGVVGVAFGRVVANNRYEPQRAGVIDQLFVRADHRRRGVASRLVGALCAFFAEEGTEDLSLRYVAGNDEAAAFWAALGFAPRIVTVGASRERVTHSLT